ncbi:Possible DNA-methyltransferase [Mycobacteroides abscessus subsp. massiliense]|nr:Possible DNA-methyltransferase [Mycobacteroides abscessus subsp. massiliense]SLI43847.1 Possible DNA-methyltransferase [Mycobacteroides abscessus subsp. massiliense]
MNAYDVLREHHSLLRQLGLSIRHAPVGSPQRQRCTEELLREFDIHPHIRSRQLELLRAEGVLSVDGRIALRGVRHGF